MAEQGRIALVTGAGSGIGRATALALLEDGWRVALAGRGADSLAATLALAGDRAGAGLAVPADVTDPDSVDALFATIAAGFGRLDLLFNNAGSNVPSTNFGDLSWGQWRHVVGVNLDGAFLVAPAARSG